ncbi:DUF3370 domain-containing protein [Synechococcus sp. A15-28]|uniref:DUF3370 domain-containing protein n=1 Tax=Synechococcus sp. A15-28 TaxID=1050638 RepID=UPI001647CA51|nr:DUF3370 domain-containing protein [Synechococcus sp. A15-28]QNI41785.1 uncharacterized conserved secreted protein (DUF3370) [Synechococcus sp. A15-28]
MRSLVLLGAVIAGLTAGVAPSAIADVIQRQQSVRSLPGQLDAVLMVNDNNPELIKEDGILLSTFPDGGDASISVDLSGRFDLFSHHVYAGTDETLDSTLWLALLMAPIGDEDVTLTLIEGSTSLSQATEPGQTAAPFLPLPPLMRETNDVIAAGPGSRVAGDLLKGREAQELSPRRWTLKPGSPTVVLQLPIPVQGLDPLLNGRNLQLRLHSSAPVALATLAAHGDGHQAPNVQDLIDLLSSGELSGKEHNPTPRGSKGKIIYSRVSGVQIGSRWQTRITDPGSTTLSIQNEPVSWPISSLERGSLGTGQVQTAELQALYPGTAWAAHGNYGVEYDLTLPLKNSGAAAQTLSLALESPLKTDQASDALRFRSSLSGPVMFRGPVEVVGLDDADGSPYGRQTVHLVLRQGQEGASLGQVTLKPGEARDVRIRLIYPADATPPQVLTVRPVKQS